MPTMGRVASSARSSAFLAASAASKSGSASRVRGSVEENPWESSALAFGSAIIVGGSGSNGDG